jgi:type IV fimbrial biogenesis protein FimT
LWIRGVTLPELMVTLAILAITATVAVPAMGDFVTSTRLDSAASALASSFQLARSEAIKINGKATVCRSSDGSSCATSGGWEAGWIVFRDADGDGVVDAADVVVQVQQALASGFKVNTAATHVIFEPTGTSASAASFIACRDQTASRRQVDLSVVGRVSVTKATGTSCP